MTENPQPFEGIPLIAPSSTGHPQYEAVVAACRSVFDPEIPVNIYDLGLIYTIDIDAENAVKVIIPSPRPAVPLRAKCPAGSPTRSSRWTVSNRLTSIWYGSRPGAWT